MSCSVVIIGAGGQLGETLSHKYGADPLVHSYTKSQLDICDFKAVNSVLDNVKPEVIINAAAYTAVDHAESEQELAYKNNEDAVQNIAKNVSLGTRIIHVSTDFVFQGNAREPYTPFSPTNPLSVYGQSKLAGEKALFKWHPEQSVVIRTSWLYAAGHNNFVTTMLSLMQDKEELNVVNDQFGSPTSADTLADIIRQIALLKKASGIYHWSDRGITSWYDYALEIQTQAYELGILKRRIPINAITTDQYPTAAKRPAFSALDSSTTEELLKIKTLPWKGQLNRVLRQIKEDIAL